MIKNDGGKIFVIGQGIFDSTNKYGDPVKLSTDKLVGNHPFIRGNAKVGLGTSESGVTRYNVPSIYGMKKTTGEAYYGNTQIFTAESHSNGPVQWETTVIPLGKQFKTFDLTLALEEGEFDFDKMVEGGERALVVEFYPTDIFSTSTNPIYQDESDVKPQWVFNLKEGEQPQKITLDVTGLGGLYVWIKSPRRQYSALEDTEGKIDRYNLMLNNGVLNRN
ncbi:hypothetical protein JSQ81_16220 [Sporosarcina sp. Marseille-Q4063]|uniref:hypothetical protein n=1 Tax=Sporosarcina sp. Marseille-Q4063 TaxID=2810514 RepID=UPI001BAF0A2B|nr:hypothetical protein [Sporosarcina sp. Marseille-Q4063]QUW21335.1 hypothetical protein JSQ81_16220 [Sporosarcina sp. Marseille-Q4063]